MMPHFRTLPNITLEGARHIRDKAFAKANELGLSIAIVVIDRMGVLILAETMDAAPPGAPETAMLKAKGAARYLAPTHQTGEYLKTLPAELAAHAMRLPDLCAMQGGVPILVEQMAVGGVGIAGGNGSQDIAVAEQAAKAVS